MGEEVQVAFLAAAMSSNKISFTKTKCVPFRAPKSRLTETHSGLTDRITK